MNASGLWQSAAGLFDAGLFDAGLFDAGLRQARQAFGDDAVDTGEGKRRAPSGVTRSEDDELPIAKRRKLLSQTRDLARNFALLGWGCVVGLAEDGIMDCDCEALSVLRGRCFGRFEDPHPGPLPLKTAGEGTRGKGRAVLQAMPVISRLTGGREIVLSEGLRRGGAC